MSTNTLFEQSEEILKSIVELTKVVSFRINFKIDERERINRALAEVLDWCQIELTVNNNTLEFQKILPVEGSEESDEYPYARCTVHQYEDKSSRISIWGYPQDDETCEICLRPNPETDDNLSYILEIYGVHNTPWYFSTGATAIGRFLGQGFIPCTIAN